MQEIKITLADNGVIKSVYDDNINGGGEEYESTTVYEFDSVLNKSIPPHFLRSIFSKSLGHFKSIFFPY